MANAKTRFIVFTALFTAISVILKVYLGIPVDLFGGFAKDINLSPAVIMYSGMLLGPMGGGLVGGLTDFLAWVIRPMGGYMPLFTLVNVLMGVLPALFFRKNRGQKGNYSFIKVFLVTLLNQTVCSFILNTSILVLLGYMPAEVAYFRGLSAFLMVPLYACINFVLLRYTAKLFYSAPAPSLN